MGKYHGARKPKGQSDLYRGDRRVDVCHLLVFAKVCRSVGHHLVGGCLSICETSVSIMAYEFQSNIIATFGDFPVTIKVKNQKGETAYVN